MILRAKEAEKLKIYTIGYTKKSAREFFTRLQEAGVKKIIDVRLHNASQLAGFAKRDDLAYFAETICGVPYEHILEFAPTEDMFEEYRKRKGSWENLERGFRALIAKRKIEKMDPKRLDGGCLVCSEDTPHHCHRRLVAEYLASKWQGVEVIHL